MTTSRINSRSKGAEGEREMCKWLQEKLELNFLPTRNLEQTRDSGADILDVKPLVIEVKRCQTLALRDWWLQVTKAAEQYTNVLRVVAYRQNQQPWRFLLPATLIGIDTGFIQLEEREAIIYFKSVVSGDYY